MRKRSGKKKPAGLIDVAVQVVQTVTEIVTDPGPLDGLPPADFVHEVPAPASVAKSAGTARRSRGPKGGAAPDDRLTAERRREIARKAAARRKKDKGTT